MLWLRALGSVVAFALWILCSSCAAKTQTQSPPPRISAAGQILDPDGKPVAGAPVVLREWSSLRYSDDVYQREVRDVLAETTSDANGRFQFDDVETRPFRSFRGRSPWDVIDIEVRSPRHAAKRFGLRSTGDGHKLAVEAGVLVRGRLLQNGKPVGGVSIGLVQCDRGAEGFLGNYAIGTKTSGEFGYSNVPPNHDFYIYTTMESMSQPATLPLRRLAIGESGTLAELGDLELGPAHTISGRLVLTDGKPLPRLIQLLLSRERAWDSQRFMVASDGAFRFENVPHEEPITLVARVPGYDIAQDRTRFQQVREWSVAFFVEGPRDDVEIFYAPVAAEP